MKLFDKAGRLTRADKISRPPRMTYTRGRCWEYRPKRIDGHVVKFYYETGRGSSMYFNWCQRWYRARMFQTNDPFDVGEFTTFKPNGQS
jgi:hypothetical protein